MDRIDVSLVDPVCGATIGIGFHFVRVGNEQEQKQMTIDEKIEALKKRRKELQSLGAQVQDVLDWFDKNSSEIDCDVNECKLTDAVDIIDETVEEIDSAIEELQELLEDKSNADA